jgi:hypothetical protein
MASAAVFFSHATSRTCPLGMERTSWCCWKVVEK